jgi:hypothetical protein
MMRDRFRANTSTRITPFWTSAFTGRKYGRSKYSSCPSCRNRSHSNVHRSAGRSSEPSFQ